MPCSARRTNYRSRGSSPSASNAPYRSGRGETWTKAKVRSGQEVVIGGWTSEAGSFRSLLVGVYRGKTLIPIGRVGTGFSQEVVRRLLPRLKALASEKSPFGGKAVGRPGAKGNVHWAKPELVAEIEFAGWSDDEQFRQASFKGLREDKDPTEVEAERPARPESTDLAAPASREGADDRGGSDVSQVPAGDRDYAVFGVVISNPDKVLWPEGADAEAVTKLELARYYEAVGPWMIGHLKGRPCSIVRAPRGLRGSSSFSGTRWPACLGSSVP